MLNKQELAKIAREIKSIKAELNKKSFSGAEGWFYADEISRISSPKEFKALLQDWAFRWMSETGDQDMKGWVQAEWKPFQSWAVQKAQDLYSIAAASWKASGNTGMWSDGMARQEALMAVLSGKMAYEKAMKDAKDTAWFAMEYGSYVGGKKALKRDRMFDYDEFSMGKTKFPRIKGVKFAHLKKKATMEPIIVDASDSDYMVRQDRDGFGEAKVILNLTFWPKDADVMGEGEPGIEEQFGMDQEEAFEDFKAGLNSWIDKHWYLSNP